MRIIAAIGVTAFIVDAGSFAFSAVCLLLLSRVSMARIAHAGSASTGREIKEGLAYVRSQTWLWATFAAAAIAYLVFLGPSEVLLPYVVKNSLGGSAAQLGTVFAVGGLGATAAAVFMGQRGTPRRSMTFVYLAWTFSTLMVCGYGLARASWQLMVVCFAFNLCESAGLIVWLTLKQSRVPARLLGRVSSLDWFISIGLMPLSYALAGPVAGILGVRPTLIWAGALGATVTVAFLFIPGVRKVEKRSRANALSPRASLPAHDLQDEVAS